MLICVAPLGRCSMPAYGTLSSFFYIVIWSDWHFCLRGVRRCKHMEWMRWSTRITACSSSHIALEEKSVTPQFSFSWREQVRCRFTASLCFSSASQYAVTE
jgi:hypothetical protein